jgi:hypothetical protein
VGGGDGCQHARLPAWRRRSTSRSPPDLAAEEEVDAAALEASAVEAWRRPGACCGEPWSSAGGAERRPWGEEEWSGGALSQRMLARRGEGGAPGYDAREGKRRTQSRDLGVGCAVETEIAWPS